MQLAITILDLVGGLLLVAAVAVLVWPLHPAAGLAAAGAGVLLVSWLGERAHKTKTRRRATRSVR